MLEAGIIRRSASSSYSRSPESSDRMSTPHIARDIDCRAEDLSQIGAKLDARPCPNGRRPNADRNRRSPQERLRPRTLL